MNDIKGRVWKMDRRPYLFPEDMYIIPIPKEMVEHLELNDNDEITWFKGTDIGGHEVIGFYKNQ